MRFVNDVMVVVALAVTLGGCEETGDGPFEPTGAKGGCLIEGAVCTDHPVTYVTQDDLRRACEAYEVQDIDWEFFEDGCPSVDRIARCTADHASGTTTSHYYPPNEVDSVSVACEGAGHLFEGH